MFNKLLDNKLALAIVSGGVLANPRLTAASLPPVPVNNVMGVAAQVGPRQALGPAHPSVITQPANVVVTNGESFNLAVEATGSEPLSYQWRQNDNDIPLETNPKLSRNNVGPSDQGYYTVLVSNDLGAVTSQVSRVTVYAKAPGDFKGITLDGSGTTRLSLSGLPPYLFKDFFDLQPVEFSDDLQNWKPLTTAVRTNISIDPVAITDSSDPKAAKRFYRTTAEHFPTFMPRPTGQYPVGIENRLLTDSSRPDRKIMTTIYYPAVAEAGKFPVPNLNREVAELFSDPDVGAPADLVAGFYSYAVPGLAFATNLPQSNLIIYSHSDTDHRLDAASTLVNLASHGYTVVTCDHPDAVISVYPDGTVIEGDGESNTPKTFADRKLDLGFLLNYFTDVNNSDSLFGHRLIVNRIGVIGGSTGGSAVAQLAQEDDRVSAAVLLDPDAAHVIPSLLSGEIGKPFLAFEGDFDDALRLYSRATSDAIFIRIGGAKWLDYGDIGLPATVVPNPYSGPTGDYRVHAIFHPFAVSFFDLKLRGIDDHRFDSAPSDIGFPEIVDFRKK